MSSSTSGRSWSTGPVLLALFLFLGSLLACRQEHPHTPLTSAAERGDASGIRDLLHAGADADEVGLHGWPPLMWAVRAGHLHAVEVLIQGGADPGLSDSGINGWTPLLHAIHKGQASAVTTLLDSGADVNGATADGLTPLMMSAGYGNTGMVKLLLGRGANPRAQTESGSTALSLAVRGVPDIDDFTLGSCQTETVRALLAHSSDLRLPDNSAGRWARRLARFFGCSEVVGLVSGSGRRR